MSWLVIADDLSGAADCAIGFTSPSTSTVVTLDAHAGPAFQADVIAADVDSRRQDPATAAARNVAAWNRFGGAGRRLYKKIDSTLRGNWAAETAALQRVAGLAIVAPAFPDAGRTLRDGCVYVHDEPLETTDIWRLEGLAGRADVTALLAAQGLRAERLETGGAMRCADALRDRLAALARQGVQAVICDAQTQDDLDRLAAASADLGVPAFWVGSGGMARALSAGDAHTRAAQASHGNAPLPPVRGPVLTLVGSLSGVSARQAACLCERGQVESVVIPPQVLRAGPAHADWARWQDRVALPLLAGHDVLAGIGRDEHFSADEGPRLSAALASLIAPHFHCVGSLIATGGETARAMLEAAGIRALALVREIEPGVPLSKTLGGPARRVVTKAGAFGSEAALWLAWQAVREA
ncbi:four-carbon acid sugar kinase family protein [Cupriavidus basilensis]|uniref:four-carbon acid sugar kinase family protein n=1 Tax=Cupriavidus basilensis TaxID=68895 RepID=UPI000750790B|nr:four-carbon acid sugar kinase family protein [Cupriavidus basilensis]